mgnify:FL=1|jgi:hypothetical protein
MTQLSTIQRQLLHFLHEEAESLSVLGEIIHNTNQYPEWLEHVCNLNDICNANIQEMTQMINTNQPVRQNCIYMLRILNEMRWTQLWVIDRNTPKAAIEEYCVSLTEPVVLNNTTNEMIHDLYTIINTNR